MPNWCSNFLIVEGGDEAFDSARFWASCRPAPPDDLPVAHRVVKALAAKKDEEAPFFGVLVPEPEGENKDWYNWRVVNWGTKWDVPQGELTVEDDTDERVTMYFSTAWSPPNVWFQRLAEAHPGWQLTLVYAEQGDCFAGAYVATEGRVIDDAAPQGHEKEFLEQYGLGDWWWDEEDEEDFEDAEPPVPSEE